MIFINQISSMIRTATSLDGISGITAGMANQDCKLAMFGDAGSSPAQGSISSRSDASIPPTGTEPPKAENVISQIVIAKGVRFPGREHDYGVRKSLREVHGGFPVSDEFRKEEDD